MIPEKQVIMDVYDKLVEIINAENIRDRIVESLAAKYADYGYAAGSSQYSHTLLQDRISQAFTKVVFSGWPVSRKEG